MTTVIDVTERVQTEAHNREQAALLDIANDAIYVTTLDCTILYWNQGAERTYGWTSAEAVNRKTTELISPDAAAAQALAAILLKEQSWSGERRQNTKSGGMVEVFSRLTLVRDERGQPQSVFAINTDITEKKQLETQYLRAQRLENIGALASGIAHDLNNVLAPIIMGAPLLQNMVKDETAHHLIKTMETSARRGAAIVKQVLTFARGVEGERVPLQPRHLLRELEKLAAETFPKGIRIESDIAADLWPVLGDATQLHQALMNLCINARDAMPAGGVLTLGAANVVLSQEAAEKIPGAQPGSYACLRVTDTGTGIPPEIEAKIFEPFFTTKGVGKGTGLGLSTVLGIVRSHGGFIRVVTKVGQGTTFELYLPATKAEPVAVKKDSATPWPHARGEGILLVDDEAAVREVARQALMEFGYQVITAGGGAEALRIFRERRQEIQLVLTDMMMPEMDGPTLVAALRVLDPAVKIVGITGASDPVGMSGLKTLALSAMLAKPFTIRQLLAVLRVALPVTAGHERAVPDGGESRPAPPG
jgi:PAS domain S-box-containing protein